MKDAVDPRFGTRRPCTNLIAPLHITLEQSSEQNSPFYINFIDYEKAFDSLDWQSLWKLLRHYSVPEKIPCIIRNCYSGMTCTVVCDRQLTDAFQIKTGMGQEWDKDACCRPSYSYWPLTGCWRHPQPTGEMEFSGLLGPNLMIWRYSQQQIQEKTSMAADDLSPLGVEVDKAKSKVLKSNTAVSTTPITLDRDALEDDRSFIYLGSIVENMGELTPM